MRIGIKFCGGCNPRYDRKKLFNKIKKSLPPYHNISIAENHENYELLIVICGCTSTCADYTKILADKKIVLISEKDYEKLDVFLKESKG